MYEPTFMRQVALAVHNDRVTDPGRSNWTGPSALRTLIYSTLGLARRFKDGWLAKPACAERQPLLGDAR